MNHHTIPPEKYAKIKRLNQKIIDLRELRTCGILTLELIYKLDKAETKLTKLLKSI